MQQSEGTPFLVFEMEPKGQHHNLGGGSPEKPIREPSIPLRASRSRLGELETRGAPAWAKQLRRWHGTVPDFSGCGSKLKTWGKPQVLVFASKQGKKKELALLEPQAYEFGAEMER